MKNQNKFLNRKAFFELARTDPDACKALLEKGDPIEIEALVALLQYNTDIKFAIDNEDFISTHPTLELLRDKSCLDKIIASVDRIADNTDADTYLKQTISNVFSLFEPTTKILNYIRINREKLLHDKENIKRVQQDCAALIFDRFIKQEHPFEQWRSLLIGDKYSMRYSCLCFAIETGQPEIIKWIATNCPEQKYTLHDVDIYVKKNQMLVCKALKTSHGKEEEIFDLLVKPLEQGGLGINLALPWLNRHNVYEPIYLAIKNGYAGVLQTLLKPKDQGGCGLGAALTAEETMYELFESSRFDAPFLSNNCQLQQIILQRIICPSFDIMLTRTLSDYQINNTMQWVKDRFNALSKSESMTNDFQNHITVSLQKRLLHLLISFDLSKANALASQWMELAPSAITDAYLAASLDNKKFFCFLAVNGIDTTAYIVEAYQWCLDNSAKKSVGEQIANWIIAGKLVLNAQGHLDREQTMAIAQRNTGEDIPSASILLARVIQAYQFVAGDFSKTNYPDIRAQILEKQDFPFECWTTEAAYQFLKYYKNNPGMLTSKRFNGSLVECFQEAMQTVEELRLDNDRLRQQLDPINGKYERLSFFKKHEMVDEPDGFHSKPERNFL